MKATGGNPPKAKTPAPKKPPKAKKPQDYKYTYNHETGLYSMDAASLTNWLMDVEGRGKLERALKEALDLIEEHHEDEPERPLMLRARALRKEFFGAKENP